MFLESLAQNRSEEDILVVRVAKDRAKGSSGNTAKDESTYNIKKPHQTLATLKLYNAFNESSH